LTIGPSTNRSGRSIGEYRIGYKVEKETITVLVMRVLPRGEIYKAMKNLIG